MLAFIVKMSLREITIQILQLPSLVLLVFFSPLVLSFLGERRGSASPSASGILEEEPAVQSSAGFFACSLLLREYHSAKRRSKAVCIVDAK